MSVETCCLCVWYHAAEGARVQAKIWGEWLAWQRRSYQGASADATRLDFQTADSTVFRNQWGYVGHAVRMREQEGRDLPDLLRSRDPAWLRGDRLLPRIQPGTQQAGPITVLTATSAGSLKRTIHLTRRERPLLYTGTKPRSVAEPHGTMDEVGGITSLPETWVVGRRRCRGGRRLWGDGGANAVWVLILLWLLLEQWQCKFGVGAHLC